MLLAQAVELLRDKIEALNWVERFGGLTQVVSYETFDQDNRRIDKTIPISCLANSKDCNTLDQFYQNLIPDSSKKSVLYFEPLQGFRDNGPINGNQYFRNYTAQVRLVGWVNSKRLGLSDDCLLSAKLIRSLFPILLQEFKSLSGVLEGAKLRFRNPNVVVKNPNIFSSYTYDIDTQFLINPYDYFAIDIDVVLDLNAGCEYVLDIQTGTKWIGTPIDGSIPANYLGDLTGTFTGTQHISNFDCNVGESDIVTFKVTGLDRDNVSILLGTFTGDLGDTLNDPTKWVTDYNIYNYIAPNLVENNGIFSFAKLDFAQDNNFLNIASLEIFIEISRGGDIQAENILYLFREDLSGLYSSPFDISIDENGKVYIGEFANGGNDIVQGFINRFYTSRNQSNIYGINRVGRIEVSTSTNAFGNILFSQNNELWFIKGTGQDSDGFTTFDTPIKIGGNYFSGGRPISFLNEEVNGEQVILSGGGTIAGTTYSFLTYEFNGVTWDFVGIDFLGVFRSVANGNFNTAAGHIATIDKTLFVSYNYNVATQFQGVSALSYIGDYSNYLNWSRLDINNLVNTLPSLGGIQGNRGIAIDTENLVNSYPTIYVSSTLHVIIKITANKENPTTTNVDFDTVIFAGQEGVAGNQNGIGTTATLTSPEGLAISDGILYVTERIGANIIRPIILATAEVLEGKGTYGVSGKTEFIEF